jgi:hypothetical protein
MAPDRTSLAGSSADAAADPEFEAEEFLRWSPHVRREGRQDEPLGL